MSILVVPEGAESLADLELVLDADGTTVPLDALDDGGTTESLDVPDGAARLLDVLQEDGEPVTAGEPRPRRRARR